MTINDLINKLKETVEEKPWVGDMIVTSAYAPSWVSIQNGVKTADKLISFAISAETENGTYTEYIPIMQQRFEWSAV